jgi:signal transduction histidine kinase
MIKAMKTNKKQDLLFLLGIALTIFLLPILGLIHEGVFENQPHLSSNVFSSAYTSGGWEYAWGNENRDDSDFVSNSQQIHSGLQWKSIDSPINPPERNGRDLLWLRYTLSDGGWDHPTVLISRLGVLLAFDAFVDDELIYSFGKDYALGTGTFPGLTSHLIPLKKQMQGKTFILKVFSDYANIGIRGKVYLGERSDLISAIIKKDIIKFVLSLFMVFLGIMVLITYPKKRNNAGHISMFGILAISQGFYMINLTTLKDFVFFAPVFWFNIYIMAMALIPIGTVGFAWETFRPSKAHFLYKLLWFQVALALVCQVVFILVSYRWISMDPGTYVLNAERLSIIVIMFILVGITLKDAWSKNSLKAKIYLTGFIPIIVCGIHDIMMGFGWIRSDTSYVPYAMMLFVLSLEIIQRVTNTRTQNKLLQYSNALQKTQNKLLKYSSALEHKSKEKEALISDLHDGIGGLITSIKFISEMGMNSPTISKMTEALKTISSLSSDSLEEIGSFMQSLDQNIDWEIIEKNFMALGHKMVISRGLSFNFKTKINPRALSPNSMLFLNLLRIYKETLTNIVKHAKAQSVDVELDASPEYITLSVKDDGKGFGQNIKKGRGLNSMKTRAQRLGGTLDIQSGDGTLVVFKLCPDLYCSTHN